jgi:uncharacterized protein YebE (UPF0316 family)
MEQFFMETLSIDSDLFRILILPLMIFFARILDVSLNTIRIIFVMGGRKGISTLLGFFESLIWLLAIGQIFQHIDNVYSYIAYPAGFAAGIYVGMRIEEHLAYGKVVVRLITQQPLKPIIEYLKDKEWRYSFVEAESARGREQLLFTVLLREDLPRLLEQFAKNYPNGFYTIESVKSASETGMLVEEAGLRRWPGTWLASVKRK